MKKTIDLLNTVVSLFFHLIYDIIYTTITEVIECKFEIVLNKCKF